MYSAQSSSPLLSRVILERGQYMPVEENEIYEFKMHTNFSAEEIPEWVKQSKAKPTRKPISRNINAFLNSGKGGMIFLGVDDDGVIRGFNMSPYQKEHLRISLEDVLIRYTPPVPSSLYQMTFIPVTKPDQKSLHCVKPKESTCEPHLVRTNKECWCSKLARKNKEDSLLYIAQITIKPVVKKKIVRQLFLDEENKCFIRRLASVHACSVSDIITQTKEEVAEYYLNKVWSIPYC